MEKFMYSFEIKEKGYVDAKEIRRCELQKYSFVTDHLSKTLQASKCGWENLEYKVMEIPNPNETRSEFLVLWAGEINNSGSRWINVTGNSLGALISSLGNNIW